VICDGETLGRTPCKVEVAQDHTELKLVAYGYRPRPVDLGRSISRLLLLNALNLGIGALVDVALGKDLIVDSAPAHVRLTPGVGTSASPMWSRAKAAALSEEADLAESRWPKIQGTIRL